VVIRRYCSLCVSLRNITGEYDKSFGEKRKKCPEKPLSGAANVPWGRKNKTGLRGGGCYRGILLHALRGRTALRGEKKVGLSKYACLKRGAEARSSYTVTSKGTSLALLPCRPYRKGGRKGKLCLIRSENVPRIFWRPSAAVSSWDWDQKERRGEGKKTYEATVFCCLQVIVPSRGR